MAKGKLSSVFNKLNTAFDKLADYSPVLAGVFAITVAATGAVTGALVVPAAAIGGASLGLGLKRIVQNKHDKKHPQV